MKDLKEKVSFQDYDGNEFVYEISYSEDMREWWKKFYPDNNGELSLKLDEEFLRRRNMKNKE